MYNVNITISFQTVSFYRDCSLCEYIHILQCLLSRTIITDHYHGPLNNNNKSGVDVYIKKDFYVDERHDLKLTDKCRLEDWTPQL